MFLLQEAAHVCRVCVGVTFSNRLILGQRSESRNSNIFGKIQLKPGETVSRLFSCVSKSHPVTQTRKTRQSLEDPSQNIVGGLFLSRGPTV